MQRVADVAVGVVVALFAAGIALMPLSSPVLVGWLTAATFSEPAAGLAEADALARAEEARAFVVGSGDTLTAEGPGVRGFDDASVSHLEDVRRVIGAARIATGAAAAVLALWLGLEIARRRFDAIARGLRAGAIACVTLVLAAGVVALVDFDRFFAGFHALFFEAGTWTFPTGTLLIALFPVSFWQVMGALWAALILAGALVCEVASRAVAVAGRQGRSPGESLPPSL